MPDQTARQCNATHDHEKHTWYDNPKMWCPGVIAEPLEETRPVPAWAVEPLSDWRKQCDRVTAHHDHTWGEENWCPGVMAHHNTQIGKGGPFDPDRYAYRDLP